VHQLNLDDSVPDWLIEYPQLLNKLEELGIDYCCGGKSLRFASGERGLAPDIVLSQLRSALEEAERKAPE
jgi:iron-sulfur cluster repair protein YtfE (RIC family)